ncbi:MAG: bifunctional isocitrate dehydrogenase kinase/phosphatase, partial [Deltaproteobacteria bacterium]|nr:bifunctional isocitrate dehydrogenase kinase/phosphatase [Deltaproteobacteria bacterium]
MSKKKNNSDIENMGALEILEAFTAYRREFEAITRQAQIRFKNRDWHAMRADAARRLDLYKTVIDRIEADIRQMLADQSQNKAIWGSIKAAYSGLIAKRNDWELAETFFNSITRRLFATIGVDPKIEFVDTDFATPPLPTGKEVYRTYDGTVSIEEMVRNILGNSAIADEFQDIQHDTQWVSENIRTRLRNRGLSSEIERVDVVDNAFYRGMGAYIVGRFYVDSVLIPMALALLNPPGGIRVDGVLLEEDEISILFSFTRSYFHVDVKRPYDLVQFLSSLLPRKRIAELYITTGFNKHGKTELYRELLDHMTECSLDQFEISRGARGMVMIVFNMPRDDIVFKLIRDHFATPKKSTRQDVMDKYDLVFKHDRAGRLVDAQAFEHLKFDECCFAPELLIELQREAGQTVRFENGNVIVDHAYVERRVTPLNIYLEEADEEACRKVVYDFGCAIKDLAVSNIFPGDILLKNFGVTRHGRVVFYDYDELCPLTS